MRRIALALALLALPAAAQEAPRPQIELRPPPAWMTEPRPARPQVELRPPPAWMTEPPPGRPQVELRPLPPAMTEPRPARPQVELRPPPPAMAEPRPAPPPAEPREPPRPRPPPPPRLGIGAEDPRVVVDVAAAPWRALGRVQHANSSCTGALVGPRTVLTAAHCLIGRGTGRFVPPDSLHFLLGYHRGSWAAEARVTAIAVDPAYDPSAQRPGPDWADWALLTLDRPVGTPDRVLPLLRTAPSSPTGAMVAGYQQDRREVLLADRECHLLGLRFMAQGRPMLVHDCTATRGASGAPLIVRSPDGRGWAVAGLLVSMARGYALGFGVPAGDLPELE